jgi:hypothetical protein
MIGQSWHSFFNRTVNFDLENKDIFAFLFVCKLAILNLVLYDLRTYLANVLSRVLTGHMIKITLLFRILPHLLYPKIQSLIFVTFFVDPNGNPFFQI